MSLLLDTKVASVSVKLELLDHIPAKELKEAIIAVIEIEGLTFGEQSFLNNITNYYINKLLWRRDKNVKL